VRFGAQVLLRTLSKRAILLLLALSGLLLVGDVQSAGVAAGALAAGAILVHAIAFGVGATLTATPPRLLRTLAAGAVLVSAGAGVWLANTQAFGFFEGRVLGIAISPGGALMHLAALVAVAGVAAFMFLAIAGRASALGDDR
jgi:hypothetical protein